MGIGTLYTARVDVVNGHDALEHATDAAPH